MAPQHMRSRWRWQRVAGWLAVPLIAWLVLLAVQIDAVGRATTTDPADAAIVLGAAVQGARPSPVFEERIRHGITLYRAGQVRRLVFTGGRGEASSHAEAEVGRDYAIRAGVPSAAILIETRSRTTQQNLAEAEPLLRANGVRTALIVSDPLHLLRALRMAKDQGIKASGAPTPTTRYRGFTARAGFLLRELFFYNFYLLTGQ